MRVSALSDLEGRNKSAAEGDIRGWHMGGLIGKRVYLAVGNEAVKIRIKV